MLGLCLARDGDCIGTHRVDESGQGHVPGDAAEAIEVRYARHGKSFEILWKWVVLAEFQRPAFTNTHGQGTDTARHTTYVNVQGRTYLRSLRVGR